MIRKKEKQEVIQVEKPQEGADVVLMDDDPLNIAKAIKISRK